MPADLFDLPVDFEILIDGSMMGSGGMIVIDEDTCMVDFARYFMKFLYDESCGKCPPCRGASNACWRFRAHHRVKGVPARK